LDWDLAAKVFDV